MVQAIREKMEKPAFNGCKNEVHSSSLSACTWARGRFCPGRIEPNKLNS